MKILLDTHVLIWWAFGNPLLSASLRREIDSFENQVFISAASIWEMAIKQGLGKLEVPLTARQLAHEISAKTRANWLLVKPEHGAAVAELPNHHRDPFDRLLVAQCMVEDLVLATGDQRLHRYSVRLLV